VHHTYDQPVPKEKTEGQTKMWIMTNTGFLSIVAHRDRPNDLLVRARRKGEIRSAFPDAQIRRTPDGDYLFRAVVSRREVAREIGEKIQNIDYDNFKDSVRDEKLHDACFGAWSVMHQYQVDNDDGAFEELSDNCIQGIPEPGADWQEIMFFISEQSQEIDGYGYGAANHSKGYEAYLDLNEEQFSTTGKLPEEIHALLATIYLVCRRDYWSGCGLEQYRGIVDACLRKARSLRDELGFEA